MSPSTEPGSPVRPATQAPATVAAIVPAFNEADTLAEVLVALRTSGRFDEILVVSDDTTGATFDVERSQGSWPNPTDDSRRRPVTGNR